MKFLKFGIHCFGFAFIIILCYVINGSAATVINDDFNGSSLDPAWDVSFIGNIKSPYWNYSVSGGKLAVYDLYNDIWYPDGYATYTQVTLSQEFPAMSDFNLTVNFAWNQDSNVDAGFMFIILPEITMSGYRDVWNNAPGQIESLDLDTGEKYIGPRTLPYNDSVEIEISRVNDILSFRWDNVLIYEYTDDTPLDKLTINLYFKAMNLSGVYTAYGTQYIDSVILEGTLLNPPAAIPEPVTVISMLIGCASLILRKLRSVR
ncbi:MAG: PEP-CTERM sorting domain-containing protein [Candidatus Auribacterota bacterium]